MQRMDFPKSSADLSRNTRNVVIGEGPKLEAYLAVKGMMKLET